MATYLQLSFSTETSNVRWMNMVESIEKPWAKILFEIIDAIKSKMPENRIGLRLKPFT